MKLLVTGGSGMLGSELKNHLPKAEYLNGKSDMDLSYPEVWDLLKFIDYYDIIIHTAAITDLNVCDKFPNRAYHLHSDIINLLQKKCDKFIYISAQGRDYNNVYFKSKLRGEIKTLIRPNDLVLRVNIFGNGGLVKWAVNELNQGKNIKGYDNVMFNPVHVSQLSNFIVKDSFNSIGIINIVSDQILSKYDFLVRVSNFKNLDTNLIHPISVESNLDLTVNIDGEVIYYNLEGGIQLL